MDLERFEAAYSNALKGTIEECTDMVRDGQSHKRSETVVLAKVPSDLQIGDLAPDGTIYAGISFVTGKAFYTTPFDEAVREGYEAAEAAYINVTRYGHKDWCLPDTVELVHLYRNKDVGALKGTFNDSGADPMGFYWSANGCSLNFKTGNVAQIPSKKSRDSVRFIRRQ